MIKNRILAIIPARGGSKGIPQKNIKPVAGKPLLAWNIIAAKESKYISRIVVSTDDKNIAEVAKQYGAEVIKRPDELSSDTATSESALIHSLNYLKETENYFPDLLVFLQCTSPLTQPQDIDNCIETLLNNDADSATTVTDFHYFIWKKDSKGLAEGINHDKNFRPRRQDREPQYLETGAVYVMRTSGFLEYKHRFFGKTVLSEMPAERVLEIDDPVDLEIAEIRLRKLINDNNKLKLPQSIKAVVFDFDGVMTDNKVFVTENGMESVRCDRADGMGINLLNKAGIKSAVMSTETNPVVTARCKKLNIECFQSLGHTKEETLKNWAVKNQLKLSEIVFVGNDVNDIQCLKIAGCAVVPADAHPRVIPYADIILNNKGGYGAVRELCDLILNL